MKKFYLFLFFTFSILSIKAQSSFTEGKIALSESEYVRAEQIFEKIYNSDTTNESSLYYLAYSIYKQGKLGIADKLVEHGNSKYQNNTRFLQLGVKIASDRGYNKKAMDLNLKWCQNDSSNSNAFYSLGNLAGKLNMPGMMVNAWQIALKNNPNDLKMRSRLGELYLELRMPEFADSVVSIGFLQDPENRKFKIIKAKASYDMKEYDVTKDITDEFLASGDTLFSMLQLNAFSLYNTGKYEEALPLLDILIENSKPIASLFYIRGVCLKETDEYEKAIENFEEAIKLSIDEKIGTYYASLGESLEDEGSYQKAIAAYKKATEYEVKDIVIYQLARSCDLYYKDKTPAIHYYTEYTEKYDTINNKIYHEYAQRRIREIKADQFMQAKDMPSDTIN
ncbi:tetratricopeptide repeat protein [Mangrovivirga cuniculi]|uniref:Uncharacterized protein n=1 Tax=Mangrovivirga cuniculi TaxID=2715131 RepID=A0A4D7JPH7_9BACT|nr:tetratricopeptide repeat protein [Mangrovivirga cuniculi]QCK16673.1 hypothetical protein DCC35_19015 [Mangrovivirga cuniculi]